MALPVRQSDLNRFRFIRSLSADYKLTLPLLAALLVLIDSNLLLLPLFYVAVLAIRLQFLLQRRLLQRSSYDLRMTGLCSAVFQVVSWAIGAVVATGVFLNAETDDPYMARVEALPIWLLLFGLLQLLVAGILTKIQNRFDDSSLLYVGEVYVDDFVG